MTEKANAQIAGSITFDSIRLNGAGLVVRGLVLEDPDGAVVARVQELRAHLGVGALLHKRIDLTVATLVRPELYLVQDEEGTNLERAIATRTPNQTPPEDKPESKSNTDLAIDSLVLENGLIDFQQHQPGVDRTVHVESLAAKGHARMNSELIDAALDVDGALQEPVEGPLHLALSASGADTQHLHAHLDASAAGAQLLADAGLDGADHQTAELHRLHVPPAVAQAFAPNDTVSVPIDAHGTAHRIGSDAHAELFATVGRGTAHLKGALNLDTFHSPGVTLHVRHLDLSQLAGQGPHTDVALDLEADGGGKSLETLDGHVRLEVPASQVAGQTLGPVRLRASANKGAIDVPELLAILPGVTLTAQGQGTQETVHLSGSLDAKDLATFSRTLGKLAGPKAIDVSGHGALSFEVKGPLKHPAFNATGQFKDLAAQGKSLNGLRLTASVPDVKEPFGARFELFADKVQLDPQKVFTKVHAGLEGRGNALELDAYTHGFANLALNARATLDQKAKRGTSGTLDALTLAYPEATWKLQHPANFAFGERIELSTLALRSGPQQLQVDARKTGEELAAHVRIDALDLRRLPKAFVDPKLQLAGRVDADVRAKGTTAHPDVVAKLSLQNGRFKQYKALGLGLDASYQHDRAKGNFRAQGAGANLHADFDVPVLALEEGRGRDRVEVNAVIDELKLEDSIRLLQLNVPARGLARAHLRLTGTAEDPRLDLAVEGQKVQYRELPPADFALTARTDPHGRLSSEATLTMLDKKSVIAARTGLTLGRILRRPPTQHELMRTPVDVDVDVRELPLPLLYTAGLLEQSVMGTLTAQGKLRGTPLNPDGQLAVKAHGVFTGDLDPLNAELHLTATADELRTTFHVDRHGTAWLDADARIAAGPAALQRPAVAARTPVKLTAKLGPIPLPELEKLTASDQVQDAQAPVVEGTLTGTIEGHGTLGHPVVALRSEVKGLGAKGNPRHGDVQVVYDYADAEHALELMLRSPNQGQLRLTAKTQRAIGYPMPEAPPTDSLPVTASVRSKDLDLAFLSNLTTAVRQLGGLIQAQADVSGTVGDPRVQGRMEWQNGRLELNGQGDLKDLHLLVSGDNQRIALEDFSAKASKGTAKLTGQLLRDAKGFALQADAKLDQFPIVNQDQLMATVSLRADATGRARSTTKIFTRLNIKELKAVLPEVKKKNLQKLDAPEDIVLVRNGKPLKKQPSEEKGVGGSGTAANAPNQGQAGAAAKRGSSALHVVMLINAPRNLWITGSDVNTEVGLSDNFRVEYAGEPQLFGDVKVLRGNLTVFGRRFELKQDSKATFGGNLLEPNVNVTATYKNEQEQTTVTLNVQGQGDNLKITPSSNPPLTESEIYTLLATGHPTLRHGTGSASPAGEAASLVGSLAASQLKKTIGKAIPLDVLSIQAGDNGLQGTKLEAGTYVNDKLYVGFTGRIGADPMRGENANAVHLEYQFTKRWSFQGEYGDALSGGADLIWSKEY